jgi:RNA polymerase sigma-70 factor, ECF subfamily
LGALYTSMTAETQTQRLTRLYNRYGGLVYRRAMKLLREDARARDACHDVFMSLLKEREVDESAIVGWFYRVTTNHCLNLLRDERRHRRLLTALPVGTTVNALPLPVLLHGIPADLQVLAVLYHIDEMTQAEVADVLGVSQRTVSSRLAELKQYLTSVWPGHNRKVASDE